MDAKDEIDGGLIWKLEAKRCTAVARTKLAEDKVAGTGWKKIGNYFPRTITGGLSGNTGAGAKSFLSKRMP